MFIAHVTGTDVAALFWVLLPGKMRATSGVGGWETKYHLRSLTTKKIAMFAVNVNATLKN